MIYVGIDPGQRGGIAVLGNDVCIGYRMPLIIGRWTSTKGIFYILSQLNASGGVFVTIEEASYRPRQAGVVTTLSGYGKILGAVELSGMRHDTVAPKMWQKRIIPKAPAGESKIFSIEFCSRMYPDVNLQPGQCTTDQDGIADAVCIAHYGMLMDKGEA